MQIWHKSNIRKVYSMGLYINKAKENWVVDRFVNEWNLYNLKQDRTYFIGTIT